jgi:hypothetical protein
MWQMAGYYDESDDKDRAFAVGGFIGHQHDCVHLELAWKEQILERYGLKYFKASELSAGRGEFAKFRSDHKAKFSRVEKEKLDLIKKESIDLILDFNQIIGIGAVLLWPDYKRLADEYRAKGKTLLAPYHFCAQVMMMESGFIMHKINASLPPARHGLIRPVFDSHEEYGGRVKEMFDDFTIKNPITSQFLLPPIYESDLDYLMLQVADNLAYESRRLLLTSEFDIHIPERIAMSRLKAQIYRIYKLNYDALKAICEAQEPESIPFEADISNSHQLLQALEEVRL